VNTWATVFLGIIAMATLVTAVLQVVLLVAGWQLVRRVTTFIEDVDREIKPIIGNIASITRDASKVATLAAAQVERADRLFADVAARFEETLSTVQDTVIGPVREGRALMSAFRAALQAIRELRHNGRARQGRAEDEDALFI